MQRTTTHSDGFHNRQIRGHVLRELAAGRLDPARLTHAIDGLTAGNAQLALAFLGYDAHDALKHLKEDDILDLAQWLLERRVVPDDNDRTDEHIALPEGTTTTPKASVGKRLLSAAAFLFAAYALGNSYLPDDFRSSIVSGIGQAVNFVKTGGELATANPELMGKLAGGGVVGAMLYGWFRNFLNPAFAAMAVMAFRLAVCVPTAVVTGTASLFLGALAYGSSAAKRHNDRLMTATGRQSGKLVPERAKERLANIRLRSRKEVPEAV